jgi:hypothetical protein
LRGWSLTLALIWRLDNIIFLYNNNRRGDVPRRLLVFLFFLLINASCFHFATQAVAGLPLSSREERAERRVRGCRPLTLLRKGWAPTKTARTNLFCTAGTISLKTLIRLVALELAQVLRSNKINVLPPCEATARHTPEAQCNAHGGIVGA